MTGPKNDAHMGHNAHLRKISYPGKTIKIEQSLKLFLQSVNLEKKVAESRPRQRIFAICPLFPLGKKALVLHFNKHESRLPNDALCQKFEICSVVLGKVFECRQCIKIFHYIMRLFPLFKEPEFTLPKDKFFIKNYN